MQQNNRVCAKPEKPHIKNKPYQNSETDKIWTILSQNKNYNEPKTMNRDATLQSCTSQSPFMPETSSVRSLKQADVGQMEPKYKQSGPIIKLQRNRGQENSATCINKDRPVRDLCDLQSQNKSKCSIRVDFKSTRYD
jgi:hypothetical protein